ncbi:DedA family protein [Caulobacter endophyticus]|uniref:DedA protein n=1 Tax=Caulobacter endophyticus TaxID=2172652 RepID=A0A2T9JI97_9CAUL|nr:VTT domain-containing protein [Caulobacter endophyticus]PVM83412.1 DedA protein [Caulobacter endophyticus]
MSPWPLENLAPILVLVMAFCEAIVLIGLFVPLTPLLLALGGGIAAGAFAPEILVWAVLGAFLGNLASYCLGQRLKAKKRGLPRLPSRVVERVELLFERHGAAAIVLSRYLGPPATIAPFLAGWSGLSWTRFLLANLVASLTWPPAMALIGYAATLGWRWAPIG